MFSLLSNISAEKNKTNCKWLKTIRDEEDKEEERGEIKIKVQQHPRRSEGINNQCVILLTKGLIVISYTNKWPND